MLNFTDESKNDMFVPNFSLFLYTDGSQIWPLLFVQHIIWIDNLFYEKNSVMALPNSTVHGISYTLILH